MKILIDSRSLGSKPSGIGMYIFNFVKALVEFQDIEIFLLTDIEESIEIKLLKYKRNIYVLSYGKLINKNIGLFGYFKFIQRKIEEIKPEIFWEVNNLIPIKIKNPYGKIVVTIHDMFPLYMKQYYGKVYPYYYRYGINNIVNIADAIIYNSKQTQKESEQYFSKLKQKEVFISYIIIEKELTIIQEEKNYFLYLGNLEKRKGSDLLLKAFQKYCDQGGSRELHLAGRIREKEIKVIYEKMKANNYPVRYLGYINDEQKREELSKCSCFIFPSRAEGFGIPIIEALNYGKAVIVSKIPIFEEIAKECLNFFEVDSNYDDITIQNLVNCMKDFSNPSLPKCKRIVERYEANRLAEPLYNFLKGLITR